MTDQTTIPSEIPQDAPKICAWCGKPSVGQIELEPSRYALSNPPTYGIDGKRTRVLRKRAIVAQVCEFHWRNLRLNDDS